MNFRIYARAIILSEANRIVLLRKRADQKIAAGKWILPGGTIEFGELPEAALSRELKEEINFTPEHLSLLGTETLVLDGTHWLGLLFQASGDVSKIENSEPLKHACVEWCDFAFARSHLFESTVRAVGSVFAVGG